jgi:anti-anti-sigma regulatory factor
MMAIPSGRDPRTALALELELGRGRRGASARVELLDWIEGTVRRVAHVTLRGRIGGAARRRLERAFEDLAARNVDHVVLDCTSVEHLGDREAHQLIHAASRLEARAGGMEVWGLSDRLNRRLSTARVRCWPGPEAARVVVAREPSVEYAS